MRDRTPWPTIELRSIIESAVDGPFGSALKTEHYVDGEGVRVVRLQNIGVGKFLDHDRANISAEYARELSRHNVVPGDLLVASMGDEANPVARTCQYPSGGGPAIVKADCFRLRVAQALADPGFVRHILNSPSIQTRLLRAAQGVTRDRINLSSLMRFAVPIPPQPEQRRIAEILDSMDESINSTERLISKLLLTKSALVQRLVSDLTNADEFGHHCRKGHYREGVDMPETGGDEFKTVADIAYPTPGSTTIGPFGSNLTASSYRASGAPVVFVRDIRPDAFKWVSNVYVSSEKFRELAAHVVTPGDVVATKMGLPPGVAAVYPQNMPEGVITADVIRIRPNPGIVRPHWLSLTLNSDAVRRQVAAITGGVTRPKITLRDYREIRLPAPPLDVQDFVLSVLDSHDNKTHRLIEELGKLRRLKQGLMEDLLTGRVRVPMEGA